MIGAPAIAVIICVWTPEVRDSVLSVISMVCLLGFSLAAFSTHGSGRDRDGAMSQLVQSDRKGTDDRRVDV